MIARHTANPLTETVPSNASNPQPHVESAPPEESPTDTSKQKNWRILVVDDRPVALNTTSRLLEIEGYAARSASTGHAALRVAGEFKPNLVLLDISLPDISGYEVFRRLKASESLARTVFFVLSGHGYEEGMRARQAGFDDYLMKPFDIREVHRLISATLSSRQAVGSPVRC